MHLPPNGREFYALTITTVPAVGATAWSASFDDGVTWHVAEDQGGKSAWLVAGPDVAQGTAVAVISADTQPYVRLTDNPAIVVRRAPAIYLATP